MKCCIHVGADQQEDKAVAIVANIWPFFTKITYYYSSRYFKLTTIKSGWRNTVAYLVEAEKCSSAARE